jgi:hypothetical protein
MPRVLWWLLIAILVAYAVIRVAVAYPRPVQRYAQLSRREVATIAAAAEATFPPGGAIPSSGLEAGILGYTDRLLAASHPRARGRMRLLFFLVEHATIFFPAPGRGGRRRFSSLRPEQQVAVLDAWAGSHWWPRRLVFASLRALLTMGYFAHPPVLRQLGVAPPVLATPVCEADLLYPRIGMHPETIEFTPADLNEPSDAAPLAPDAPLDPRYAGEAQ